MNVRNEIRLHAKDADKPRLNWLFDRYHWASQWSFVALYTIQRYGMDSYKCRRTWAPTPEGQILYDHAQTTYARLNPDKESNRGTNEV